MSGIAPQDGKAKATHGPDNSGNGDALPPPRSFPMALATTQLSRRQRKRRRDPLQVFGDSFGAAIQQLAADFLKSSAFEHTGTKGTAREQSLAEFLRAHLPEAYGVSGGEVVDSGGTRSPQLDIMVYDKMRNHAIVADGSALLPAEALLTSIEVKSTLTRAELAKSLRASAKLMTLRPFKLPLSPRRENGVSANSQARYFHSIFSHATDLSGTNWLSAEHARLTSVADELKLPVTLIDRIYVVGRGLIQVHDKRGLVESTPPGRGFMFFYMHLLGFVLRENRRRNPVPYLDYAGHTGKGWEDIA